MPSSTENKRDRSAPGTQRWPVHHESVLYLWLLNVFSRLQSSVSTISGAPAMACHIVRQRPRVRHASNGRLRLCLVLRVLVRALAAEVSVACAREAMPACTCSDQLSAEKAQCMRYLWIDATSRSLRIKWAENQKRGRISRV